MEIIRLLSISILLSAACLVRADAAFSSTAEGKASAPAEVHAQGVPQPNSPATSAVTGRKFGKMAEPEIQDFIEQLEKQPFPAILQAGIDADSLENDESKTRYIFLDALPEAMKKRLPGQAFLEQLKRLINNNDASESERLFSIDALGRAQRQETAALLLELAATTRSDPTMHWEVGDAISELGRAGEKFIPLLEQQWHDPNNDHDRQMLAQLAHGMVLADSPSSLELLLDAALMPDGKDDVRKQAANRALDPGRISNLKSILPLAARLSADDPTSEASQLASFMLLNVKGPAATQALVAWMQKVGDDAAPLARQLALGSLEPKIWEAALKPEVPFHSEKVRAAIRAGLDAFVIIQKNVVLIPDWAKADRQNYRTEDNRVMIPFLLRNNSNEEVCLGIGESERELATINQAGQTETIWVPGMGHGSFFKADMKPGETVSSFRIYCSAEQLAAANGRKVFALAYAYLKGSSRPIRLTSAPFLLPPKLTIPH
jgi:hypothetical protein